VCSSDLKTVISAEWRPSALLTAVVQSYPFQFQQQPPNEEHTR